MYGIRDGHYFLVDGYISRDSGLSLVNMFFRPSCFPVMFESAYEADIKLQEMSVYFDNFNLVVYEFSKEEEAEYMIRKLRGY